MGHALAVDVGNLERDHLDGAQTRPIGHLGAALYLSRGAASSSDELRNMPSGSRLSMEHLKNQLPVSVCSMLVVNVTIGQCISVICPLVNLVHEFHLAIT
jgi:hypothetical protein